MLQFQNVYFAYVEEEWVLKDVSFSLNKGELISVIGSNGSGKSTIARLANGLLLSNKGEVLLDNLSLKDPEVNRFAKFKVGVVFQNPDNQFVGITVEDDLAFGLENMALDREEIRRRILDVSEKLGIRSFLTFPPTFLSGGEKQKVAIASILVINPDYIVFDEVTSLLDPLSRKAIVKLIHSIAKDKGVLYITHHPEETINSDKIIVLHNGEIVKSGTPEEVFKDIEELKSFGVSNLNEGEFATKLKKENLLQDFSLDLNKIVNDLCSN